VNYILLEETGLFSVRTSPLIPKGENRLMRVYDFEDVFLDFYGGLTFLNPMGQKEKEKALGYRPFRVWWRVGATVWVLRTPKFEVD